MRPEEIWDRSLEDIKGRVGEGVFDLWFSPVRLLGVKDGTATFEIPNRFFKEWIEDYHPDLLGETLERVTSERLEVRFKVAAKEDAALKKADARLESRKTKLARKGIYLNPRYTFENFVVGPSNQFASAAAAAVSENPGRAYSPLFVYGGVGLGKTHLVTAIANKVLDRIRDYNVLYVPAEQFTNEVVSAFRHGKAEELKARYRSADMLIIDDIQFVQNKIATQEELFHTINTLYEGQKQIVLSSDRPPAEMKQMADRLRSRFSMGLIADIQAPEVETKIAIIHKKSEADGLRLPDDVIYFIAARVKSNVRDLEGCLIRLGAHSSLTGTPITIEMARNMLRDFITEDDRPLTVESIMKSVAEYFGLRVQDMKARKRTKDIALPRQIAMYLSRELTESSLSDVGKHMGGKDHATVIYACKRIEDRRGTDESFDRMLDTLKNKIKP